MLKETFDTIEGFNVKRGTKSREYLEKNLTLNKTFFQTYKGATGEFVYYRTNVKFPCKIKLCTVHAFGSMWLGLTGQRLSLCKAHLKVLMKLQNEADGIPKNRLVGFWRKVKKLIITR